MAVISISITESSEQITSGIPRLITLVANIPSTIFYTIDGTTPDTYSNIYTSQIVMPTDKPSVTLKVFATNGVDSSTILSFDYYANISENTRLPHSAVTVTGNPSDQNLYPFGTNTHDPPDVFNNNANAGISVDLANVTSYPDGYDASGNPGNFTDSQTPDLSFKYLYSTTDRLGNTIPNIGTLPTKTTIKKDLYPEKSPYTTSDVNTNLFNPRAMVIVQDFKKNDPTSPPMINRQSFSLENLETTKDGSRLLSTEGDTPPLTGSFLRSHFNPTTNEITYYYFDSSVCRWIISTQPYVAKSTDVNNFSNIVISRTGGVGFVYKWIPGIRRILF